MTYLVRLWNFRGLWREIICGHHFDLDTMETIEFHKTPIIPPEGRGF